MKKNFTINPKRQLLDDARRFYFDDCKVEAYILETNNMFLVQVFTGRKTKPTEYRRSKTLEEAENIINEVVKNEFRNISYRQELKLTKQKRTQELKRNLTPGSLVRAVFSYNMTFNKFYRVISNKGCTYKFEVLAVEWVDGDRGWTGNVTAGEPTGSFIFGKVTPNGLKIDDLSADIIDEGLTFYENHLD